MRKFILNLSVLLFTPLFIIAAIFRNKKRYLIWGSVPIINNKYWSESLKEVGYESLTIMQYLYSTINKRSDFDLYFEDFSPKYFPSKVRKGLGLCFSMIFVLRNAKVIHISFNGFSLDNTFLWKLESFLFKLAGIKVVVIPFGMDAYMYSKIIDPCNQYALLASYPKLALKEEVVEKRVKHWVKNADIVLTGFMIDGIARWDVTSFQAISIDIKKWVNKKTYSQNNGINGPVKIIHTPNHRGGKGTEFVIDAVNQLQSEGLLVELILLEKIPNEKVRELMYSADILAEQFIVTAYALSGIEGMSSGLPVLANLENESYTRVFRRYSFLNECPILSTSPETLVDNLRLLVKHPQLREELGKAGRAYVEKYHSYKTSQYLFGSIYDKILLKKNIDLLNLFHPLKSTYNNSSPFINHPLQENKLHKNILF